MRAAAFKTSRPAECRLRLMIGNGITSIKTRARSTNGHVEEVQAFGLLVRRKERSKAKWQVLDAAEVLLRALVATPDQQVARLAVATGMRLGSVLRGLTDLQRRITLGADKGHDVPAFVKELRLIATPAAARESLSRRPNDLHQPFSAAC
jgi:hypothetical protein